MKRLIPFLAIAILPICLQAQNIYTSNPGAVDIDIAPSTILDASGGRFTTDARFFGTGDLTVTGGQVDFRGGSSTFVGDIFVNSTVDLAFGSRVLGDISNTVFMRATINTRSVGVIFAQDLVVQASGHRIQPAQTGATQTWAGNVTFAGDYLLRIGNGFNVADRNLTISGDISDGGFANARIDVTGAGSLFTFSGNNNISGLITVMGTARLNIDGTHTGGSLRVNDGGILGGSGTILIQDGMRIFNQADGTLDLEFLTFDVSSLASGGSFGIVNYTNGTVVNVPTNLQDLLVNSPGWTIFDTGTDFVVTKPIILEAPVALDFGLDKDTGGDLLRNRPGDITLQEDSLRLESNAGVRAATFVEGTVGNYQERQNFVVESEMTLLSAIGVGSDHAGLLALGYALAVTPAEPEGGGGILQIRDRFDGDVLAEEPWGGASLAFTGAFADDFSDPAASELVWNNPAPWKVGVEDGRNVFATDPNESSTKSRNAGLRSPPINLTGFSQATLSYSDFHELEDQFHWARVSVLRASNPSDVLQVLDETGGVTDGWRDRSFSMSQDSLAAGEVILEFRIFTDNFGDIAGWSIADVKVSASDGLPISYSLKAEGNFDPSGLTLSFTVFDGNVTQTLSRLIENPVSGNTFGFGAATEARGLVLDFSNLTIMLGEVPAGFGFDEWAQENIPEGFDRGFSASPAGDGIANGIKFAFGLDNPMEPVVMADLITLGSDGLTITYQVDTKVVGVKVTPEVTLDIDQVEWFRNATGGGTPYVVVDEGIPIEEGSSIRKFTATAMNIDEATAAFMRVFVESGQ